MSERTPGRRAQAARALVVGLVLLAGLAVALGCRAANHSRPEKRAEVVPSPPPPPPPVEEASPPPPPSWEEAMPEEGEEAGEGAEEVPEMEPPEDGPGHAAANGSGGGSAASPPALVDKNLRFVRLFYGTNRARSGECAGAGATRWDAAGACRPNVYYGGLPAVAPGPPDTPAGAGLEVGTTTVTFPPDHAPGKIERPPTIFSFELRDEHPDRDVLIAELRPFAGDYDGWVREVRATGRDQAFIYVHGFETTFDEAARRAAQVAYDLDFDLERDFRGIPMLFSWPSLGELSPTAYLADYDAAEVATDAFNRFLDLVKIEAGVHRVHVIAHSMGNRVVAEALRERGVRPQPIVDQLVLAAPDIWASLFKTRFLRILPKLASRVTLYVSDGDRALVASSRMRRGEPRAGQVAGGLLGASAGVDGFDAIDASGLKNDFLGHSYYASNDSMLSDLYCLLKDTPAAGRPLLTLAGAAWTFRPLADLAGLDAADCSPPSLPPLPVAEAKRVWPYWAGGLSAALLLAVLLTWLARRRRAAGAA